MPSSRHLLLTLLTKMPWGLSTPHLQTSSDSCRALEMVILTIQQKEKQKNLCARRSYLLSDAGDK